MRPRMLGLIGAALAVALAAPSSAAPDRTLILTKDAPSATWNGSLTVGTVPFGGDLSERLACIEPTQGCDETLIQLKKPGTLTVIARDTGPLPSSYFFTYYLGLFRSDASGRAGVRVGKYSFRNGEDVVTATDLPAGHYLARVVYGEGASSYAGRATFVPTSR